MKTSVIAFCDIHVELLLEHQVKENLLNEILHLCNLKFQDVYYSKVTQTNAGMLRQPHLLTVMTKGKPYWMYCTRIEGKEYCVLIEKFLKPGYPYPKMVVGKFVFDPSVYTNTLFECELTKVFGREKEWLLLIQDMHVYQNNNMRLVDPITRFNQLHYIFDYLFTEDLILQPCVLQVKRLFSAKDMPDIKRFCRELPYSIQGILFTPMNTQYACLYWDDVTHQLQRQYRGPPPTHSQQQQPPPPRIPSPLTSTSTLSSTTIPTVPCTTASTPPTTTTTTTTIVPPPEEGTISHPKTQFFPSSCTPSTLSVSTRERVFSIKKSALPGVYTIVNYQEAGSDNLHIPGLAVSKKMKGLFMERDVQEMRCTFNADFQKWEPVISEK